MVHVLLLAAALALTPAAAPAADTMTLHISAPAQVSSGEPVPITITLTNDGDRPLTLLLRGRPIAFDIVVRRYDGTVAWRRLAGAAIAMVLQVRELAPGESIDLRDTWRQTNNAGRFVAPGDYTIQGLLLTDGDRQIASDVVPLRIAS
ncbi:MAG TPA: BsuPI-related putative proteinase inhibitor [Gemmatimonadales bacterium]|nr:BsuPI-related putative proteinase inhibitor [Gemmatimonadales bacterium]